MIINLENEYPSIVRDFMNHPVYRFYLTGSRFFGNSTRVSDWDFFIDYNHVHANGFVMFNQFMVDNGFSTDSHGKVASEHYCDSSITHLYRKPRTSYRGFAIDVQVVRDAELKHLVQNWMKQNRKHLALSTADPSERSLIWNEYMDLAMKAKKLT